MSLMRLLLCAVVFILTACAIPTPPPASTEMEMNVNGSEWNTLTNEQKEAVVEGYNK